MDMTAFAGLAFFASVAAFTPGPNNVMLASSGATFGFRRSLPNILGVIVGFTIMVLAAGFGFASILNAMPALHTTMRLAGIGFLVFLAWKIGTAGRPSQHGKSTPLSFMQGAVFQLINPKGLTLVASIIAIYSSGAENVAKEMQVILPLLVSLTAISACTWCLFGKLIGRLLTADIALRRFNILMAALLILSLIPILPGVAAVQQVAVQ